MLGGHDDADELPSCGHIVLLGEADLSFALALGRRSRIRSRVTATELGDPADVRDRYFLGSDAALAARCDAISCLGIRVVLGVCARRLEHNGVCHHWRRTEGGTPGHFAAAPLWDDAPPASCFVFNFPHSAARGRTAGMLRAVFRSVRRSVACGRAERKCRVEMRLRHAEEGGLKRSCYGHEEAAAAARFGLVSVGASDLDVLYEFGYQHRTTERDVSCGHLEHTKVWRWAAEQLSPPSTQILPPGTRRDYFFAPEKIMDRGLRPFVCWKGPCKYGRLHYLVRWRGHPGDEEHTWEEARDLELEVRKAFDSEHAFPAAYATSDEEAS